MKRSEMYEEYLKQSELSEHTRQVYLREAEKFIRYLNGKEVTKERTLLYKQKLQDENLAPATINLYVIAVNRYLRYLECEQAFIKTLKVQKKNSVENVINRKEYQELLDYAKSSGRKNIMILFMREEKCGRCRCMSWKQHVRSFYMERVMLQKILKSSFRCCQKEN